MWLDTRVKSTVSEDPSTSKMVKEAKYISKLNNIQFTIFIDPFWSNSGWKSLSGLYAKS